MNADIKKRWIAALRSGEYQQGQGELKTSSGTYCCLGVLCELAKADGVGGWNHLRNFEVNANDLSSGALPAGVREWAGLESSDPRVVNESDGQKWHLSSVNDNLQFDFNKIADLIEEQL